MKRIKSSLSKILLLMIACLSVGTIACASSSATTEVQIAIEGSDMIRSVQTGDGKQVFGYLLAAGVAAGLGIICVLKKKRKGMLAVLVLFLSMFFVNHPVYAADRTDNVNITIPSSISVSFEETGNNSISDFTIHNQSLVPVSIESVHVTECNDWKLCDANEDIPVNTKQMAFLFEGQCLKPDNNHLNIEVKENSSKNCNIQIDRGAWTSSNTSETAMQMEFEYTIGQKEFQLAFDVNGSQQEVASQMVSNGNSVSLPNAEREGYVLLGWEDSSGNLYTDEFVMPIGDVTLTAKWKEKTAYAIYIAQDTSLRFVQSAEVIQPGSVYKGMTVTDVFTGFDKATYRSKEQVPWYDGDWYETRIIKKVIVEDVIQPVNIAYWFYYFYEIEYMDISKLDTSKVQDMSYAFYMLGLLSPPSITLVGIDTLNTSNVTNMQETFAYAALNASKFVVDLSRWDVSKVTNMRRMFNETGYSASTFGLGDLSKWNVSNVTDMYEMFNRAGLNANWYLDCSQWNVSKVKTHPYFDSGVDSKIKDPHWVY